MGPPKADPAALAARWLPELEGRRVLVVDVPGAPEAEALSPAPDPRFHWFCTHWPTHRALEARGHGSDFGAWVAPGAYDAALVFLPKGRERIRMTLAMVAGALPVGSPLWLVGVRRSGIESVGTDLEDVAELGGVEVGKHARLVMAHTRVRPDVSLDDYARAWSLDLPGQTTLPVVSLPGVFSHGRLDDGTRMLLQAAPHLPGPLLDVGCGAGVIGAWYAHQGAGRVTLVDADALALEAARRTLQANAVSVSGEVSPADVLPADGQFASIVSNPPFHQGVDTDHRVTETLISGAAGRLAPGGGTLTLVCNRFLPVPKQLVEAFGSYDVLAEDGRYRVYRAGV